MLRRYTPAAGAFLLMMSMALTTTGMSFFVGPVCGELGLSRGGFTVCYSLMTAAGTLTTPFLGQAVQHWGVRTVAAMGAVWTAAGLMLYSLADTLWMFYAAALMTGCFGTACVTLCASVTVQSRYHGPEASRLTGLVMAGSGVGGMIVSALIPGLIQGFGWRNGYRMTALFWLLLGLSAWGLLGRKGERSGASRHDAGEGMTRREALGTWELYLLTGGIFLLSAASGVQQSLPGILGTGGLDTAQVSAFMSVFTAALALGKILQGLLFSKAGIRRGGMLVIGLYALGFLLLRFECHLPGLLALAVGMGSITTLMPIVTRSVFGGREYASIWSILSAFSNLGAMIAAPLFGVAFDMTGSYGGALIAAAVLVIPALMAIRAVLRRET